MESTVGYSGIPQQAGTPPWGAKSQADARRAARVLCTVRSSTGSIGFFSPMGDGAIWGPSRNCPPICGDCERGLDPAGAILPEASSTL